MTIHHCGARPRQWLKRIYWITSPPNKCGHPTCSHDRCGSFLRRVSVQPLISNSGWNATLIVSVDFRNRLETVSIQRPDSCDDDDSHLLLLGFLSCLRFFGAFRFFGLFLFSGLLFGRLLSSLLTCRACRLS